MGGCGIVRPAQLLGRTGWFHEGFPYHPAQRPLRFVWPLTVVLAIDWFRDVTIRFSRSFHINITLAALVETRGWRAGVREGREGDDGP